MLTSLEHVSRVHNIDYELGSGSALGAVKLQNFIPWDIDIDIVFNSKHYPLFKPGGEAYDYFKKQGIEMYGYKKAEKNFWGIVN